MYIDTGAPMFCIAFVCMHALFMKFHVSRHMFLPKCRGTTCAITSICAEAGLLQSQCLQSQCLQVLCLVPRFYIL